MDNLSPNAQATLDGLAALGNADASEIRETTKKSRNVTDKAIKELATAGLIVEVDTGAAEGTPARWQLATPAETDTAQAEDGDTAEADTEDGDDSPGTDADTAEDVVPQADQPEMPADDPAAEVADEPVTGTADEPVIDTGDAADDPNGEAATSTQTQPLDGQAASAGDSDTEAKAGNDGTGSDGEQPADGTGDDGQSAGEPGEKPAAPAPVHQADRRVLAIRGALGDFADGATVDELVKASGYAHAIVDRLLLAMEGNDSARRIPADPETKTPLRWIAGEGKASEVDPSPAPPRCPTCQQVIRSARATSTVKTPAGGTRSANIDGNEAFGRGELEAHTLNFINARPGHVLTPQVIASGLQVELGRESISSGAVRNNCTKLAAAGRIQLATESPLAFEANPKPAIEPNPAIEPKPATEGDGQ